MGTDFSSVEVGARYESTRMMVVAEASGEHEAREGLPLRPYAQAGGLFAQSLQAANVNRSELAITNCLRCRPKNDWLEGAPYAYQALNRCVNTNLKAAIEELKPRVILAFGGTAFRWLVDAPKGKYGTLDYCRGFAFKGAGVAEGTIVIPTYHSAYLRRGKAELTSLLRKDIRRAFLIAIGRLRENEHFYLDVAKAPLRYQTSPSVGESWAWARAIDNDLPLYWDCETPRTAREDEGDRGSFTDRDIKLAQFSQRKGEGIALPYRDEFIEVIKFILATPTLKVTQNGWNFDEPVASSNGIEINLDKGSDDVMVMFGRVEPDLPANLQAIAQYCGFGFPWKHLGDSDIEFYGCADVDVLAWVYPVLKSVMEREETWEPYVKYFRRYHPILRKMADRGLPINEEKRLELGRLIEAEEVKIDDQIKSLVPIEVLTQKQKKGLKRAPKDTTGLVQIEVSVLEEEKCHCLKKDRPSCPVCLGLGLIPSGSILKRWATPVGFNPNSPLQMKRYMKFRKHSIPKHAKRTDVATGEASETTEVKELERLATKTKDPIYSLFIQKRQLTKLMGVYVEGWAPGRDGRIHATFSHKATWQPSSKSPNIFNGIKRGRTPEQKARVKAFNGMQQAEEGKLLINIDLRSFHAQTMACEVGNKDYLRLTKLDQHSFTTCHFIKHSERHNLLKWSDTDLKSFFAELKADKTPRYKGPSGLMTFKEVRDGKTKSAGLGIGFGMQGRKLYQMYQEDFENEAEAKAISNLIRLELFDGAIGKWQERVKREAQEEGMLRSKYGAIRRFYDVARWSHKDQRVMGGDQAEAAIAFLPASNAFGYMRDAQLRGEDQGYLDRYGMVNSIYDSVQLHVWRSEVEEAIAAIVPILEAPSEVLVYPVCPNGLSVEAEASVGPNLAEMVEVKTQ